MNQTMKRTIPNFSSGNKTGVMTHIYSDGNEIQVNLVDEHSSTLVTFSAEQFEAFAKVVARAREPIKRYFQE